MAHPLRGLCAKLQPMINAIEIELQPRFLASRDRVEITQQFEARTSLPFPAIGNDHVIKGLVRAAAASQTNSDHNRTSVGPKKSADSTQIRYRNKDLAAWWHSGRHPALEPRHHARQLSALHTLHQALHVHELLEQAVHVLHLYPGTGGDPPTARTVDDPRLAPLLPRHRIDDCNLALELAIGLVAFEG